jgi:hypothetical protein
VVPTSTTNRCPFCAEGSSRTRKCSCPCKAVAFHPRSAHRRLGARGAAPPAHARPPAAKWSSRARWLYVCNDPASRSGGARGLDKPALRAICEDTRNAVRTRVRLCPTACPTRPEFPMFKPNQSGIIIRVSGVRVPPPASRTACKSRAFVRSGTRRSRRVHRVCTERLGERALAARFFARRPRGRVPRRRSKTGSRNSSKAIVGATALRTTASASMHQRLSGDHRALGLRSG